MSLPTLTGLFTSIANAIRSVKGTSSQINAVDFPTQILSMDTSDATATASDIVENKTAYVNGQKITGTMETIDLGNYFGIIIGANDYRSCILQLPDTLVVDSTRTSFSGLFAYFSQIKKAPFMDTRNITDMGYMFQGCILLEDIPLYDTSKVTTMQNMFANTSGALTDESLDNILQMCINATSYTATKTLYYMGFKYQIPAARFQGLPHYQDFTDAGWRIS